MVLHTYTHEDGEKGVGGGSKGAEESEEGEGGIGESRAGGIGESRRVGGRREGVGLEGIVKVEREKRRRWIRGKIIGWNVGGSRCDGRRGTGEGLEKESRGSTVHRWMEKLKEMESERYI